MNCADAIILNAGANSGNALSRWKKLLPTEAAARAGLAQAPIFDGDCIDRLGGWVSEQIRGGARRFVAAGGDGTVHLVLGALLAAPERKGLPVGALRLGAVGLGSSNDYHKPSHLPGREKAAGVPCRLDFLSAAPHDVGRFTFEGAPSGVASGTRYFIINASIGVTAEANWQFNEAGPVLGLLKRRWVDAAIIGTALKTLGSYRSFPLRLSMDAAPARELMLTNLGIVKNVHFSGQMRYDLPQVQDDGLFGVHVCDSMSRLEMIRILVALNSGRFQGISKTSSRQAQKIIAEADQPFAIETDGEVLRARRATFENLQRELYVCP